MSEQRLAFFDLETVPDWNEIGRAFHVEDEKTARELVDKEWGGFPKVQYHRIVCCGVLLAHYDRQDIQVNRSGAILGSEVQIVQKFWSIVRSKPECMTTLVSYNGRRFDLPLVTLRSLAHRLEIPAIDRYRYNTFPGNATNPARRIHWDLYDDIGDFGAVSLSLDAAVRTCDLPGKGDTNGVMVEVLYANKEFDKISRYCLDDVYQTYGIALSLLLSRGHLTRQNFDREFGSLEETIERNRKETP